MNIVDKISQHRVNLMATAITLVVVYHYKCWVGGFPWYIGTVLKYGFIGVDMFFFLSGFGLTYSFKKNTIGNFYINRCRNIIPVYLLYGAILVLVIYAEGKSLSLSEILYKYSTLEYTFEHKGVDWYISAILQLYLLFPVLYHVVKFAKKGIVLTVPIVFAISYFCDLHWSHLAMLQRIPMFLLGIYCAQNINNNANVVRLFAWHFVLFLLLIPFSQTCDINFLLADTFTPVILYLSIALFDRIGGGISVICLIGRNTLQIYYGTNLALLSYSFLDAPRSIKTIIFLLALIFGSYMFRWIADKSNVLFNNR